MNPIKIIIAVVVVLLGINSVYVVTEREKAVQLRFGRMVVADVPPGLHFKIPFADKVRIFDGRVLTLDTDTESFFTSERKRLDVDSYVQWRVANVERYYRATGGDERVAMQRLAARANDGLRNEFGVRTLHEVVSGQRDQLMEDLTADLNESVSAGLGIQVLDVRIKRIELPREVSESVFNRMRTDREKEASELRAQGREQAEEIRSRAERDRTVIEANAYSDAERIRGEGDAEATSIYAEAFGKNPEFYAFTRSLDAYRRAFSSKSDVLVLDPGSDFFRYLNESGGGR